MIRFAVLLIALATPALSQKAAEAAAAQLAAAQGQLQAADGARDRIAALTKTVQAYEAGLTALRAGQRTIALRETAVTADLASQQAELAQLLGALSVISNTPQPVQRAHPGGPLNTVRAGMLVADITPGLQAEVVALQGVLAETRVLRTAQDAAAQTLADGLQGAQTARAELGQAVSERTDLPQRFEDDPVQTALLVASAETLGDFAADVANTRPSGTASLIAQGALPLPVSGRILPDDNSGRSGLRIAVATRALVTAPAPATVLFQGPLLDYGTVVILEPAADVLFIMAGLAEVFTQTGQVLPADAPIGLMADATGTDDGILTESRNFATGTRQLALYLEVREGQTTVDPGVWFALHE